MRKREASHLVLHPLGEEVEGDLGLVEGYHVSSVVDLLAEVSNEKEEREGRGQWKGEEEDEREGKRNSGDQQAAQ